MSMETDDGLRRGSSSPSACELLLGFRVSAWMGFTTMSAADVTMPAVVTARDDVVAVTGPHLLRSICIGLVSYL